MPTGAKKAPKVRGHAGGVKFTVTRFFGLSPDTIETREQAAAGIHRAARILFAYAAITGVCLFFLAIPSFIGPDGGLATETFWRFFAVGRPFTDSVIYLGCALVLDRHPGIAVVLGLLVFAVWKAFLYSQLHTVGDFLLLFLSLIVLLHAFHIAGLLPLLRGQPERSRKV